jgi:hypothetical protein
VLFRLALLFWMSLVMWRVLLCQVSWLLALLTFHIANKATTATQLATIARASNTKDRECVVLSESFVLVEFRDVAFVIVPSFVAVGFFGISLPIKLRHQPRNLVQ